MNPNHPNHRRTLTSLLVTLLCLTAACSSSNSNSNSENADPEPTTTPAPTATEAPATVERTPTTQPDPTTEPTPTADPVDAIDFDNPGLDVDLDLIADLIAQDAIGDPEWIGVMADLLARDWLLGRYPAEIDPLDIYSQSWVDEVVADNNALFVDNGWERRSEPPRLLVAERSRETGGLTEIRVRLFRGPTQVVSSNDGSVVNPALGGTGPDGDTGLFKLGTPDDGSDGWRIFRIDPIDNATEDD